MIDDRHFGHSAVLFLALIIHSLGATTFADEDFDYFQNNWNVIGLKDYEHGTRVTPDNRLQLDGKAMVAMRIGNSLSPLSRRNGKTLSDGWLPIILVSATEGQVRYDVTLWATPLPTVSDWKAAFDWPVEGENYLNWIRVKASNTGDTDADAQVKFDSVRPSANRLVQWHLSPGAEQEVTLRIPYAPVDDRTGFETADPDLWLGRTIHYWQSVIAGLCHIQVPSRKATKALLAAHVCQLIANDLGEVHGGEGFYDQFYIRDGAYQVMELEEAGLSDASRKAVDLYLRRQRPDGRFESQKGQFDANGQALWVLWQFYKMSADRHWLAAVYPRMRRAVDWTMQARRRAPSGSPFAGVLPNALADGEFLWNGKYHIVGYDLWNLRGILCTADAARILGKKAEAEELQQEADRYRQAIDAAWKRTGLAYFPPSWEEAGTHWGNTETLWPTELFARDDARVSALIDHVRNDFHGGYIEGTIQWHGHRAAIHPYMGAYTTMADLVLGNDERVIKDFYWYLVHSTAAHAFPEGIYPELNEAWNDTIPHVTGACNFALMLRHMLVHEEGPDLHLLKAVPDWWLEPGQEIRVERAPTHFGFLNLVVRGTAEGVQVDLERPSRQAPRRIVLHLPDNRPLLNELEATEVQTRSTQKQRWDYPTVVKLYKKPDAPSLTMGKPATCSAELPRYPARLANDGRAKNTDAYWAMDVGAGDPAWWQVDFEQPTTIGRVVVVGFFGDRRVYGFTVETSVDGRTWKMVADRRENQQPSTAAGYRCSFEPHTARYLRVTQTSNSANTGRHLVEVMAFPK